MECSICYSEINKETGKVELSCLHHFHFSCLAKWFDKQRLGGSCESCPLCRNESGEFEKMPDSLAEEEEEEGIIREENQEENQEGNQEENQEENQEDQGPQDPLQRMQRESVAVGNAITGPVGLWRKTRYGSWVMVSQRN